MAITLRARGEITRPPKDAITNPTTKFRFKAAQSFWSDNTDRFQSNQPMTTSKANSGEWIVWRQDDNGNRFVVQTSLTHEQAKLLVKSLEEKGHKQVYWYCPTEPQPKRDS